MSYISLLQTAAQPYAGGGMLMTVLPFLLIIVVFYFFMIRPQNKKQKEIEKMRDSLRKGDKVVTIGGIHGTVSSVKEATVIIKVEDGSKIEFDRSAIATVAGDRQPSKIESVEAKTDNEAEKSAESESSTESENK